jgi:stage II sporulation protein D
VFFHAACGGHTVDANRVWPGANAPDVVGIDDRDENGHAWCTKHPGFAWQAKIATPRLADVLQPLVDRKLDPGTITLVAEDPDGVVWRIGDRAGIRRVPGARLQPVLGRAFGYDQIGSSRFKFRRGRAESTITGNGFGHGVGLCQAGAAARASAGREAHDIVTAYFPKLRLKTGPLR